MEAETVAFGYPARALVLVQRVRNRTFGYPRHAPSLTASDGLALLHRGWDFRSDFARMAEMRHAAGRRAPRGTDYPRADCHSSAIARCVAIAKVVMGGRRYGRTVGTTLAPALSADAAVTIVVPGRWTPVPSPKSIK